ncbi:GNAT family N-acetyltransferase [Caenimonas aquaedulcis]|uniref:GNAT family N-acetyltransferase n=1 Tax=Caenimonas aquaedulcis TaxID=2793270 RepID=A0A931H5Q1_9BURK|nr:GNAT family N-acetyltransferase [Caenimonas aquaedulcis]MBG9388928.1 GNAT family N-acetyltransferase [Caenimonas aquaedulcis]
MQIRRLGPDDAQAYRALRLRALKESPQAFTSSFGEEDKQPVEKSRARLAADNTMFWGACEGAQLCGMVGLERETREKARHKATVVGMYVAPENAGAGVGRGLVDALLAHARDAGLELLVLTVTEGNAAATRLYEAAGFRSFGIEPRAIKVDGRPFDKNHMYLDLTAS